MIKQRYKKSDAYQKPFSFRMTLRDWRQALNSVPSYRVPNGTLRFQTKFVTLITTIGLFALFFIHSEFDGNMTTLNDVKTKYVEYNRTYPLTMPKVVANGIQYRIGMVADLDTRSKSDESNSWVSYFLKGTLIWNAEDKLVTVFWDRSPVLLKSSYGLAGRGMELSELTVFDGRLLTFDDRTGLVYEIKEDTVIPWIILTDGDGNINKGFKSEWATVKDSHLYVGSMGKEWTTSKGVYVNHNPMWIKRININGEIQHVDWQNNFRKLRQAVDIDFPGYIIHEAGVWSQIHKKWFFLPRRSSRSFYDEVADEQRGTNILLMTDKNFNHIEVKHIGDIVPIRGFSSFKFIPSTNDNVIAALKTEEFNSTSATYVTVFTIGGKILLPEVKVSDLKYEGIEFI